VALCLSGLCAAQTLKMAALVPEGSLWDKSVRQLGADAQEATGGRVRFQLYPGGVAGDEPDFLRKIRIGQLQGALFTAPGLGDIDPAFHVFEAPLLFRDDAEVRAVLTTLGPDFRRRLQEKGFELLYWVDAGWMRIFATRPVRDFDDFKTLKQFVWGSETSLGRWYQELGMRPVALAATDVLTGLQTGLIEALPATPLAALSLQWFRSAPYMIERRFAPLLGAVVISQKAWDRLAAPDKETLLSLAGKAEERLFEALPQQETQALAEMTERGLHVVGEPASDGSKWTDLGQEFQRRFRSASVPTDFFDRVVALLEEHRRQEPSGEGR